jgi:hypothetical protein
MISAEFPDPVRCPGLYKVVCDMMTHGPCRELNRNAPCMKDGRCSKGFPKPFCEETTLIKDGYPKYCHRNDGRQHNVRGHMLDNRWIVPYSPWLLWLFQCHINLEFTFNVRWIKYLYKGHDRTTMEFGISKDEIKLYLDACYVSSHEACWSLLAREIHTQEPAVMALTVHEKDHQNIPIDVDAAAADIINKEDNSKTTLMGYFERNITD